MNQRTRSIARLRLTGSSLGPADAVGARRRAAIRASPFGRCFGASALGPIASAGP